MKISIITLFPDFIEQYITSFGILLRAIERKLLKWQAVDLRKFGLGLRQVVDDRPYGGGVGMVLRPDVVYPAIAKVKGKSAKGKTRVIMLSPRGKRFTQKDAQKLTKYDHLIFVTFYGRNVIR
jgi:tRNA (guanine37-N1)-methyltransferase